MAIAIIVFAVSISIWFHSMSEHRHEQHVVRAFLLGLSSDLTNDVAQLNDLTKSCKAFDANYQSLAALDAKGTPDGEKFEQAFLLLLHTNAYFGGWMGNHAKLNAYLDAALVNGDGPEQGYQFPIDLSSKIIKRIDVLYAKE
ncbi:hypothetical protein AB4Z19_24370 [Pseudoduganella sp. RAF19]|uniref:hypothetical protein n=1 Tax=Pseudoduganella sp. RAF19 TaxID=3233052 RepID=UPI003F9ACCF5